MNGINKKHDLAPWLSAFLLFIISYPKWLWSVNPMSMIWVSLMLLVIAHKDISLNNNKIWGIVAIFFQIIIIAVAEIMPNSNMNGIVSVPIKGISFATIFLCSSQFWRECVGHFVKMIAIILILAIVEHLLINFFNIELVSPYNIECPTNKGREYTVFLFNCYLDYSIVDFNRFYAFYDEPGVLGNIVMVLLYIQKFDLKKWYNIVIFVAGILSFSLTFYIAVAIYFLLYGNATGKAIIAIISIMGFYYFYNNEIVYNLLFRRLEFDNGQMVGYNRENLIFDSWFSTKHWTDYFLWGYQPRYAVPYAASWKWAFALWGIVPSLIYLFTIVFPRAKKIRNTKDFIICMVLVVIIWIQRPFVYQYLYVFLLVIPFIFFGDNTKIKTTHT